MKDNIQKNKCPLCGSKKTMLIQKVDVNIMSNLYKVHFGYNIKKTHLSKFINFNRCEDCDLEYFSPPFVADDHLYSYFEKFKWYYLKEKPEFDVASKFIKKADSILEIGSGEGNFAKHIKSSNYTGIELNSRAVLIAKNNNINVIRKNLFSFTKSTKKYDVVCMFQLLEHVDNVGFFLKKAINLLKKGGYLIISVPSNESLMGRSINHTLNLPPHHQTRWSDKCLENLVKIFDMKMIKLYHEPLNIYHRNTYLKEWLMLNLGFTNNLAVNDSPIFKLVSLIMQLATFIPSKFVNTKKILGQSVTVVYRKI